MVGTMAHWGVGVWSTGAAAFQPQLTDVGNVGLLLSDLSFTHKGNPNIEIHVKSLGF